MARSIDCILDTENQFWIAKKMAVIRTWIQRKITTRVVLLSVGATLLLTVAGNYVWFRYGWATFYPICTEFSRDIYFHRYVRGKLAPHYVDRFSYWIARSSWGPVRRPDPYTIQLRPLYVVAPYGVLSDKWLSFDSGVSDYGAKRTGIARSWDRIEYRHVNSSTGGGLDQCTGLALSTIARDESWELIWGSGRFPYNTLFGLLGELGPYWFMILKWLTVRGGACDLCVDPNQKPEWLTDDWQPIRHLDFLGMPLVTR